MTTLDDLKTVWQAQPPAASVPPEHIRDLIQARGNSALGRINQSIRLEAALLGMVTLAGGVWFALRGAKATEYAVLGAVSVGSFAFYYFKYQFINNAEGSNASLRESLAQTVRRTGRFVRAYYALIVAGVPLTSGVALIMGTAEAASLRGQALPSALHASWPMLLGVWVAYSALWIVGLRWYIHRLYGRHYRELQACLRELSQIDP